MGRPFWGRANGPYWISLCGPIIDHLRKQIKPIISKYVIHQKAPFMEK